MPRLVSSELANRGDEFDELAICQLKKVVQGDLSKWDVTITTNSG